MDPGCLIRTITTICVPLVFGLIVFVGIFGNALVIIVVATNAQAGTIHKKRNSMKGWVQTPHTGLIGSRSFQNYAFKGWLSLETMKLWLLVLTKTLF